MLFSLIMDFEGENIYPVMLLRTGIILDVLMLCFILFSFSTILWQLMHFSDWHKELPCISLFPSTSLTQKLLLTEMYLHMWAVHEACIFNWLWIWYWKKSRQQVETQFFLYTNTVLTLSLNIGVFWLGHAIKINDVIITKEFLWCCIMFL